MDASYKIQRGIHVHLIQFFMCPEFWVHIRLDFDVYIVVLVAVSARTGNNLVEVTVRMLYDNGYVVGITGSGGAAVARAASRCGRTAACQHAGTQSTC